jgi:chaperone modulatory protein CbpM
MSHARRHYPIPEACAEIGIEKEFVIRCIRAHWISPASPSDSALDAEDLARIRLIHELMRDFGVNEEAIPVILHLLDQIYYLRSAG